MSKKDHKKLQKTVNAKNKERVKAAKGKQMSGKGDKPRPTNLEKYRENFDKIFNNPEMEECMEEMLRRPGIEEMIKEEAGLIKKNQRRIKIVKTYVDINNVKRLVVNINDSLTNRVLTEAQYLSLTHECNREDLNEYLPGDVIDISTDEVL